jgi:hypothetical protein
MKASTRGIRLAVALGVVALVVAVGAFAAYSPNDGLATARSANAKFASLALAKQAGYGLLKDKKGIACIAMPPMPGMAAGAMGVHYANPKLVGDGALDVRAPEALVYQPVGRQLRLAALEYVVIRSAWLAKHTAAPVMFGHRFNLTPAGNRFGLPAFYSLHVWLFKQNPSGEFSMWNPEVKCP